MSMGLAPAPATAVAGLWIASGVLGTALAAAPLGARLRMLLAIMLGALPLAAPFLLAGQAAWIRFLVAVHSALCAMRVFDLCARRSQRGAGDGEVLRGRELLVD